MIKFLMKGLLRDRSRSLFPVLTVTIGVVLTVFLFGWIEGMKDIMLTSTAKFSTGHMKIVTRAAAKEAGQLANDLALMNAGALMEKVRKEFPDIIWTQRILFGGLLDIPDEKGETKTQGPVAGLAVDLFSPATPEPRILNLAQSVVRGSLPARPGEILISEDFAVRLGIPPGATATLIGSTIDGSMAAANFTVAGTVRFGIGAIDRGAMIADLADIRRAFEMQDAVGEILGFFKDFTFRRKASEEIAARFNAGYSKEDDEFSPVMAGLRESSGLGSQLDLAEYFSAILVGIFVVAMSIVLWNAGLMGSLRRYGEIGLRLAVGEDKGHIYRSMIAESVMIGLFGSVLGTVVGLAVSYYLQAHGIDVGSMMNKSTLLVPNVIHARVTPAAYYLGFIPGLLATLLGTCISGAGIYRRRTSQLMKELES